MNLRLFVAIQPPEAVRRRLAATAGALRQASGRHGDGIRWVAPERLHLTLQFLGAVPEDRLEAIRAAIAEVGAAGRPFRLEVRGAGGFPSARRPRVIFAGVSGELDALGALADALGRSLAPLGLPPGPRPLTPHVTLGRSRDGRGAPGLGGAIAGAAPDGPVPWRVEEMALFRSRTGPEGPRYEALHRAALGVPTPE